MDRVTTEVPKAPGEQDSGLSPALEKQSNGIFQQPLPGRRALTRTNSEWNIRNILVPTDYSPASTKAIERAVVIANQCEAAITILHVIDVNVQAKVGTARNLMEGLWSDASKQMANLAFSFAGQVHAQTLLAEGLPWEVITEKSGEFDLVVVGKGHRRKSWSIFSQHTAARIIENATCPVMVIQDLV